MTDQKLIEELNKDIDRALAEDKPENAIFVAGGAFSVCWSNMSGAGEFESERANQIAEILAARLDTYYQNKYRQAHWVDAHSVKSGLHDPEAQQRKAGR